MIQLDTDELKLYLRVDSSDEDTLIAELQAAAEEYLVNAGVAKDYERGTYKLAIKILVSHWYDNRGLAGSISKQLEYSLSSLISQLKYTQVVTDGVV